MKGTKSRTKQLLPSQLQPPSSAQSPDIQPSSHHDNVKYDVPIKGLPEPVDNDTSYELDKREPVDSDLSRDLNLEKPVDSDIGVDIKNQRPQFNGGKGEVVGDQDEMPAEDPNLVCLPLRAGRGKAIG